MKKIVTIGGGSGQSTLLRYLKLYKDIELTALVSMVDDGGSTGRLRDQLGVLPPGDLRQCISALAPNDSGVKELLEHRFDSGDVEGHTAGNLMLAALEQSSGDIESAVNALANQFKINGRVIPITNESSTLFAKLENGDIIEGETNIDIPQEANRSAIESIYIDPVVKALPAAQEALLQADLIVITIGDLYTSAIPNLLIQGVVETLEQAKAPIVYTCNRHTKASETSSYTAQEYVDQINAYLGNRSLDYIIVDNAPASKSKAGSEIITYNKTKLEKSGLTVVEAELATVNGMEIDGDLLASTVHNLCNTLPST